MANIQLYKYPVAMTFRNLLLYSLILVFPALEAQVFINEFQASNISTILSWDDQYREWIEVGNSGPYAINLQGYSFSTDLGNPQQYVLSTKWIDPGEYVLIWLERPGDATCCSLRLDLNGGVIALFSPEEELLDSISYPHQFGNVSFGRRPDFPDQWAWFPEPTPREMNNSTAVETSAPSGEVNFSIPAGFYSGGDVLELYSSTDEGMIRYTLDGSWPTESSDLYENPLILLKTCIVRARIYIEGRIPGPVATRTYLVDESSTLPVVSLVTDDKHFFDDRSGIYVKGTNGISGYCMEEPVNWNQDWERPVNFEYFETNGSPVLNQMVGVRIHGGCSRMWDYKSFALFARNKYGHNRLNYNFFQSKDADEFKSLILRNSGNDAYFSLLRDGFMQSIVEGQMDLDCQGYQPALIYINGDFWGILNVREKINEDYPASNYDFHSDIVDMLERDNYLLYNTTIHGSGEHYRALIEFVESHNLSVDENYRYVQTQMDVNEYMNYFLSEIYFENEDWPRNNMKYWRPHTKEGRWRWILFDTDFGWGLFPKSGNSLELALNAGRSSLLINSLLENDEFRNEFIQRMASLINTTFDPLRVNIIYDSIKQQLTSEIQRHMDRWGRPTNNIYIEQTEEVIPAFTAARPGIMRKLMMDWFGIEGMYSLSTEVDETDKGYIIASGVKLPEGFTGSFFKGIPLELEAVPASGYAFSHWEGGIDSHEQRIFLEASGDLSIRAVFIQAERLEGIRINEICASNEKGIMDEFGQREDWIEIHNLNEFDVDLAGLYISDDSENSVQYMIPSLNSGYTIVPAGGYCVIWCDEETSQGPLHTGFKLSRQGECIRLLQQVGNELFVLDSVAFPELMPDLTYGRRSNSGNWEFMSPTPLGFNAPEYAKELLINEFLSKNCGRWVDEFSEADDWIEIYNPGNDTIDLAGLFLTDSLSDPLKYMIPFENPETRIPPKGYLVIWADNQPEQGPLHLDFKLDGINEQIGVYQLGQGYLDSISYDLSHSGVTLGRFPDGHERFNLVSGSPGMPNNIQWVENLFINEFMASNKSTLTDPKGELDDWIEIYNQNDFPVNIAGLYMTDSLGEPAKYRIPDCQPEATAIPAGGFLILWADGQDDQGPLHLGFKLDVDGESIGLVQEDGITYIDSINYGTLYADMALGRISDGDPSIRVVSPSPGLPNQVRRSGKLYISEFSASGNYANPDANGEFDDWIEIFNGNDYPIDLGGYFITDSLGSSDPFRIGSWASDSTTIGPGEYLILWADGQPEQGILHLGFRLKGEGEQLALLDLAGSGIIDSVSYPNQYSRFTFSRYHNTGDWMFLRPTPGQLNVINPVQGVFINEFMTSNTGISSGTIDCEDWIELYNSNEFPVDIGGLYLSDSAGEPLKFRIPSHSPDFTTIDPFGYFILIADGNRDNGLNHTNFKLNRKGESIILTNYDGFTVLDSLSYNEQYKNSALSRIPGTGEWYCLPPTMGKENVIPDYSGLLINEVMGYNRTVACDEYNEYDDWIELYNFGDAPIDIGGMYITDSLLHPTKFRISSEYPDSTTIPVGGYLVLWADDSDDQGILHLGFNISKTGETLGIFGHDLSLVDTVTYPFISPNLSWGRTSDGNAEWIEFQVPTPQVSNLTTLNPEKINRLNGLYVYPNPVLDMARIQINMEVPAELTIEFINSRGIVCDVIHDFHPGHGSYTIDWSPDRSGIGLKANEMLLCRVISGNHVISRKILVISTNR